MDIREVQSTPIRKAPPLPQEQATLATAAFDKSLSQAQRYLAPIGAAEEAFKQKFREKKETNRVLGITTKPEDSDEETVYGIVQDLKKTLKNLAAYERTHLGL